MRKYLSLITEHPDESKVGKIESRDKPAVSIEKGEERTLTMRNVEGDELGDEWTQKHVGLGYADFENEEQYKDEFCEVVLRKLDDVDNRFVEKTRLTDVLQNE